MKKGEWSKETKMLSGIFGQQCEGPAYPAENFTGNVGRKIRTQHQRDRKIESKKANLCLEVLAALAKGVRCSGGGSCWIRIWIRNCPAIQ